MRKSIDCRVVAVLAVVTACGPADVGEPEPESLEPLAPVAQATQAVTWPFMTKSAQQKLMLGSQQVAGPAANIYGILHEYYRKPVEARAKLDRARQAGVRFARFWASGLPEAGVYVMVRSWQDQEQHADYYRAFKALVDDATSFGIQLIPVLGGAAYERNERPLICANRPVPPGVIDDSISYVPGALSRTVATDLAVDVARRYKNSSTILFWQLGNETNLFARERNQDTCALQQEIHDWLRDTATTLKANDPNHLIANGAIEEATEDENKPFQTVPGPMNDMADYFAYWNTDVANIDIATFHIYQPYVRTSETITSTQFIDAFRPLATSLGKAFFVGEFGAAPEPWSENQFPDSPMSLLLAASFRGIEISAAWAWDSTEYADWDGPNSHPEKIDQSLDLGEDDDFLGVLRAYPQRMGRSDGQSYKPLIGNFDGSNLDDLGARSNRGLFQVSTMDATPQTPSQWLSQFGDDLVDTGGAPFQSFVGDWNQDHLSDIGVKSRDGRWFLMDRDPTPGTKRFINRRQLPDVWGNDYADPAAAPFTVVTGCWDTTDARTDVGLKSKDGRWFFADMNSTATRLVNLRQASVVFGSDTADPTGAPYFPFTGDWNQDFRTDVGVKSRDGRWFLSRNLATGFTAPGAPAITGWGNDLVDTGGAPFRVVTGDWNNDAHTDVGVKSRDGRWFFADANAAGTAFVNPRQVLSNFGNDNTDAGGAPFLPFSGRFNADFRTDIGVKSRDGRWFLAYTTTTGGVTGQTAWLP